MLEKYKEINVSNIDLWDDNPRGVDIHNNSLSQREILDSFFNNNKKIKEMKNLAEDIAAKKLSPIDFICIWHDTDNNKFISMDGNRRVLSLKILFDPSLIGHKKELYNFYSKIDTNNLEQKILAYVTTDYHEALEIVEKRHLGEDEGRGLKTWESKEKDFFKSNIKPQTTKQISNSYLLRTKFKDKFEDIIERLSSTSVDRIIGYKAVREHFQVSDYSFITEEQADNLLDYLKAAEVYQEEYDIRLSRFKVSDAMKVIESISIQPTPLILAEEKSLPNLKLSNNPKEILENNTLQLESLILNKNEFTNIKISPLSNKTHYNPNLNIFESTNQPGNYEFKVSGFRGTDEIASTVVTIKVKKPRSIPLAGNSHTKEKTLISKSGYPINISPEINNIVDEINSVTFDELSYIITISLRFVLYESIKVLFNNKQWLVNFNNLKDSIQKLKEKLLEQDNQTTIQTKTKSESNSVKNMVTTLDVEQTATLLNHITHTSRTQISSFKILDLAQNEISTLLVYISALLN